MLINLLYKTIIAILDILLLDFYLRNFLTHIYQDKFRKNYLIIYSITFIMIFFTGKFIDYFILQFVIFTQLFTIFFFIYKKKFIITKKLFSFYFIKMSVYLIVFLFFEWLFDTKISTSYFYTSKTYFIFIHTISSYFVYTYYFVKIKLNIKTYKYFKIISIYLLIFFSLIFIIKNPILFKMVGIARTYIFTVVISIVALICFDRMQAKYEAEKHSQEAMIQNMTKEIEFIKQLEKQQAEIRKINHNLNNMLIILQSHLNNEEYDEAKEYIENNLKIHVKSYQNLIHTGIPAIDSTINYQMSLMKEKNIEYHEDITKMMHLGNVNADDLSLVVSLALDNAREACEKVDGERHISLNIQSKQTHVIVYITNSIVPGSQPHFHKTSKEDKISHGHGVKSIHEIAKRYCGDAHYDVKDDQVILKIILQK